jgi:GNAT superfamily N-acetyltransferase
MQLIGFDPKHLPAFRRLNQQWIETYFAIEPADIEQLQDPVRQIIQPGGEILFLLQGEDVVGTCALVPHGESCFELAKMAVDPSAQGKGYGDLLMKGAIAWARQQGAKQLMLLSNTKLVPAISLYKKHGFQTLREGVHPSYARCNIEMVLYIREV